MLKIFDNKTRYLITNNLEVREVFQRVVNMLKVDSPFDTEHTSLEHLVGDVSIDDAEKYVALAISRIESRLKADYPDLKLVVLEVETERETGLLKIKILLSLSGKDLVETVYA